MNLNISQINIPVSVIEKARQFQVDQHHVNLDHPHTIQDKIAYIGIYENNLLKTFCADKILLHEYSQKILGKDICVPIIKVYHDPVDIDKSELPDKFVLKANHGSGYNLIVTDKNKITNDILRSAAKSWLSENFALRFGELQYYNIKPKVFVEKYMQQSKLQTRLIDYKFSCFNGNPSICRLTGIDESGNVYYNYYDMNFNFVDLCAIEHQNNPERLAVKPENFQEMVEISRKLSKDFNFVRVDLYDIDGIIYLGELTFTPGNAGFRYKNRFHDSLIGNMLTI